MNTWPLSASSRDSAKPLRPDDRPTPLYRVLGALVVVALFAATIVGLRALL